MVSTVPRKDQLQRKRATGADKLATVLFEAGLFLTADGAAVMDEQILFTPMNSEGVLLPDCARTTDGQGIAACQLAGGNIVVHTE